MITLHTVSKEVGKGGLRSLILDQITWLIPPRSRFTILGQQGSGKTTLLQLISGERFPTSGWVERRGSICPARGLLGGVAPLATPRQIVKQLAQLYDVNPSEVMRSVDRLAELGSMMERPLAMLPKAGRHRLNIALTYSIPFDFYLFDGNFAGRASSNAHRMAFERRSQDAGMILATSAPKVALQFGGTAGILLRGKIYLFDTLDDAIKIFNALPPPHTNQFLPDVQDDQPAEIGDWI